jgi:hypothetical protein
LFTEKPPNFSQSTDTSAANFDQTIDRAIVNINDTSIAHAMVINNESFILLPPKNDPFYGIHGAKVSLGFFFT